MQNDHNTWHYLYYFAYLKEKRYKGEHNLVETFVADRISGREYTKFFPIERAMNIEFGDEKNEVNTKILSKVTELEQSVRTAHDAQDRIMREYVI